MKRRNILQKIVILFLAAIWLTIPAFSAAAACRHKPNGMWYVDDPDNHWQTCRNCGEKLDIGAHEWVNLGTEEEIAAQRAGKENRRCKICYRVETQTYPAPGHDWDGGTVLEEATCTKTGTEVYTCRTCGETENREIPVLSHTPGTAWESNSGQHWHLCTDCGGKLENGNHIWTDWEVNAEHKEERICKVCEKSETRDAPEGVHAPGENWESSTKEHWHLCTDCGEKFDVGNHLWTGWTAGEDHQETRSCKVCGVSETREAPELIHIPGASWESSTKEHWHLCTDCGEKFDVGNHLWTGWTAGEDHQETRSCKVCGVSETREAPELIHIPGASWESSTKEHWHLCTDCGEKFDVGNHIWTEWTAGENHQETRSCKVCGVSETREAPEPIHTPGTAWETSSSQHWHICAGCGGKVDMESHAWTNWITGANGQQTRSCTGCGYKENRKNSGLLAGDLVVVRGEDVVLKSFVRDGVGYAVADSAQGLALESRFIPFVDMNPGMWHYNMVQFVANHELLIGVGNQRFAPNQSMTRAMLAMVIYRLEGSPDCGTVSFQDVPQDAWYAEAVAWAAGEKILLGVGNNQFLPNRAVTREEIVTILYRYAEFLGLDCSARGDLHNFLDSGTVSGFAVTPMGWAVGTGMITGYENGCIRPRASANRAEVAAILQRLVVRIAEEQGLTVH